MHYLALDTNTWIYLANGTEPVRLLTYIKQEVDKNNIVILLPEIIVTEWESHKDKTVIKGSIKHFNDVSEALDKILKLLGDKGERDVMSFLLDEKDDKDYFKDFIDNFKKKRKEIEDAIKENIKLIDDLFKHKSTIIIKTEDDVYIKSGKFAIEKKAPFKNKNSFADALIVFSFIEYVAKESIEGAIFVTYNTEDFCEKKEGKKYLHPDLEPDFTKSKSLFYTILGEAMNTIKEDIVSKEELEWIKELQEEAERDGNTDYCEICANNNSWSNEVYFGKPKRLFDERIGIQIFNPNQIEFEFSKVLEKTPPTKYYKKIEVGHCSWCNAEHFKCVDCGSLNALWDNDYNERKECDNCGLPYYVDTTNDNEKIGEGHIYRILKDNEICEKCGNEFEDLGNKSNICENCESEYSYGEK